MKYKEPEEASYLPFQLKSNMANFSLSLIFILRKD